MFNFNSTLLKTSVFTSQEKPTSVHQLLNHNYSQKAQAASPLKRFLNMCVCPRDSVCPALLRRILAGMVLHPPTPSCNRRYLPPVSPWSRLLKQDLKQRATLTSYFVFFHKIQHSILSLFTSLSSQKNIQAVRHSSLSSSTFKDCTVLQKIEMSLSGSERWSTVWLYKCNFLVQSSELN